MGINRPDEVVVSRIAKADRLLDYGIMNTEFAYRVYTDIKESAGTETKSCIGKVLKLFINGPIFENSPRILSAKDDSSLKMVKILRVAFGQGSLESQEADIRHEIFASETFSHEAIVPSKHSKVEIDRETAIISNCRVGVNDVLIMPWYITTVNNCPSSDLVWIARQGQRIFAALEFIHEKTYVHLDIKATNIFVDSDMNWFLGDFGSCKPIGEKITSSTFQFYFEEYAFKPAEPKYDWFMFLVLLLIETLEDRRAFSRAFYTTTDSRHVDLEKVLQFASRIQEHEEIRELILNVLRKCADCGIFRT